MDNRITQTLRRYHDRVSLSREVMFTALYGSQNYGLDTPESDVDAYSVTVPSRHELIFGCPSGENPAKSTPSSSYCYGTGKVTVKDVRQMMDAYIKQSINFCETLFTPYIIINPRYAAEVAELRAHAEKIASADLYQQLRTTEGMLQSQMMKTHAPTAPTLAKDAKAFWEEYKLKHDPDEHRKARAKLRNELADIACSAIAKNIERQDGEAVE